MMVWSGGSQVDGGGSQVLGWFYSQRESATEAGIWPPRGFRGVRRGTVPAPCAPALYRWMETVGWAARAVMVEMGRK